MLYIVDGTGEIDDALYRKKMENGHCRKLERNFRTYATYIRGPGLGGGTNLGVQQMAALETAYRLNPLAGWLLGEKLGFKEHCTNQYSHVLNAIRMSRANSKVYLCGYSRGGATVVAAANALNKLGREVEALFLFDPVDSDATLEDTAYIPTNVRQAFMAYRNMEHVRALQGEADRQTKEARSAAESTSSRESRRSCRSSRSPSPMRRSRWSVSGRRPQRRRRRMCRRPNGLMAWRATRCSSCA
jgi:thioesterase domain-containing protein